MKFGFVLEAHVVFGIVAAFLGQGCAHDSYGTSTWWRQETWRADLDECREVSLSLYRVREGVEGKPNRKYEQLTLQVRPRKHLQFERAVKTVDLKPGVPRGQLKFEDVEVRADPERRRVWFVDRTAGRVIATLDRLTGATTGPDDESPVWATPDGGVLLELRE